MSQNLKRKYQCQHMTDDEFISYLGRSIRFCGWMLTWSKIALALLVALLLADAFLNHHPPLWLRLTIYAASLVPLLALPFREHIYRNWKWIPEED